jgi:hypothetical protein
VRTGEELDVVVRKTLDYQVKTYGQTALLSADGYDVHAGFSFSDHSDAFAAAFPVGWKVQPAYIDALGLADARQALLNAIGNGVALTAFVGHSGPTMWSFSGLFDTDDALQLTNSGRPTAVIQWGCWNTYHVEPQYETLAHVFLLAGDSGAAAVLGSTTLTRSSSSQALSLELAPLLAAPGVPVGEAIAEAKTSLAKDQPGRLDVLLGWTLLGDPALVVEP